MSKEAMKLALEALNTTESNCGSRAWEREQEAIAALREALAEQPAQQEPVACVQDLDEVKRKQLVYEKGMDWKDPLYTSPPPQRKPLTDDRVWLEYMQLWPFRPNDEPTLAKDILRFARAIEAAHGIKENT